MGWRGLASGDWLVPLPNRPLPRVLEEPTYTAWDLEPFAAGLRICWAAVPLGRGSVALPLRAELDAALFHLYLPADPPRRLASRPQVLISAGYHESPEDLARLKASFPTPGHAVDYILDTFPVVRRKDEEKYGDYRTKLVILDIYDRLQQAIQSGEPCRRPCRPEPPTSAA